MTRPTVRAIAPVVLLAGAALAGAQQAAPRHAADGPAPAMGRPDTPSRGDTLRPRAPVRHKFWPDTQRGPAPLPGALLPQKRIITFYGNPRSTRMGILGQIPPQQMMAKLESLTALYRKADTTVETQPALHLIAVVAQASPGRDGKWRARMSDSLISTVYGWARSKGWPLFLDVQVGQSTVAAELEPLRRWLALPDVHLALDPEFAMKPGRPPGRYMGSLDASDVNHAVRVLAELVEQHRLPPKVLVVHRFTRPMLTNSDRITLDPRVQVLIHMDGFGSPALKQRSYDAYVVSEPVQFVGYKLFFKNDKPMLTPAQAVALRPTPLFISYQ